MKVVNFGNNTYNIYDESLVVCDKLPAGTYEVEYSEMSGFYLRKRNNLEVKEDKIYGEASRKIDKVFESFGVMSRSLGVILSGERGIGKTLFSCALAKRAIELGVPVILVSQPIEGAARYIDSIKQDVMVLFDEFDKMFKSDEDNDMQAEFLSLFDGTSSGKKLFVITCNSIWKINDYFLNRPGRFHYHFRFSPPKSDEVRAYLTDNVDEKYHNEIENVVQFSYKVQLNYDCLRAIAFELNLGERFQDIINDINILNTEYSDLIIEVFYKHGGVLSGTMSDVDMFSDSVNKTTVVLYSEKDQFIPCGVMMACPKDIEYSDQYSTLYIDKDKCMIEINEDDVDRLKRSESEAFVQDIKSEEILYIKATIEKSRNYKYLQK